jgi:hypothetical protein
MEAFTGSIGDDDGAYVGDDPGADLDYKPAETIERLNSFPGPRPHPTSPLGLLLGSGWFGTAEPEIRWGVTIFIALAAVAALGAGMAFTTIAIWCGALVVLVWILPLGLSLPLILLASVMAFATLHAT